MDEQLPDERTETEDMVPALWHALRTRGDAAARERLVEHYMRFATVMAAKAYARRSFGGVDFEDYRQYATVGLLESIDRFDPARAIKFETFAASRITGAVLNGLETTSDIQGQVSARRRLIAARTASLGDDAADDNPDQVFAALAEVAIGLALGFALEDSGMYQSPDSDYPDRGYAAMEMKQFKERALAMVALLPGNQRLVLQYHYLQQIAFDQIALMLDLSKGRIAQIHKEALRKLQEQFREAGVLSLSF
jgi:RNA polymerase sigma factor for flagellar operon FliA